jgi:small subunit ribosomal protein S17
MREVRKKLVGTVVSHRMQKTAVVRIERVYLHPRYHKYMHRHKEYKAHDEQNQAKVGDKVEIAETRPLSRTKAWRLVRILES